jgi:UTP--glucose-1-phosphate uridylyltransferase
MGFGLNYLVIPAAGFGTRMRTVTPDTPKEMLPVLNKPAIQYAVEEGVSVGIKNIIIIINRKKEIIREYFEEKKTRIKLYPFAAEKVEEILTQSSVSFLYQREPLGEADAIRLSGNIVGNNALAIIYPDNIYFPAPGALRMIKPVFERFSKDVTVLTKVTKKYAPGISNAGRVDVTHIAQEIYRIKRFLSKKEGQFVIRFKGELRACGISITGSHIFGYIEQARQSLKEKEFTDFPVRTLMLKENEHLGCCLSGIVFDIGNPKGYDLCMRYAKDKSIRHQ